MKRIVLFILLAVGVLFPSFATAWEFAETTGEQTTSAARYTGKCVITSVHVITDGSNNATLIIKDSVADSGTVVFEMTVVAGDHYGFVNITFPIRCDTGIYGKISGTGASYIIGHIPR